MNRWKITFIFLSGFMLHEVMTHLWLGLEGLLPLTSKLFFGLTITSQMNTGIVVIDTLIFLIFVYMGFFHEFGVSAHTERHA